MNARLTYRIPIVALLLGGYAASISATPAAVDPAAGARQPSVYVDSALPDAAVLRQAAAATPANTLHLFSHGRPGELLIDGQWRDAPSIAAFVRQQLGVQASGTGSGAPTLNIYGCEFARGAKGMAAVHTLETLTGLQVAASTNITGRDGDWVLEAGGADAPALRLDYAANLQAVTGSDLTGSSEANASTNCSTILAKNPSAASKTYWLDADGDGGFPAAKFYCHMNASTGDGWILIQKSKFAGGGSGAPGGPGKIEMTGDVSINTQTDPWNNAIAIDVTNKDTTEFTTPSDTGNPPTGYRGKALQAATDNLTTLAPNELYAVVHRGIIDAFRLNATGNDYSKTVFQQLQAVDDSLVGQAGTANSAYRYIMSAKRFNPIQHKSSSSTSTCTAASQSGCAAAMILPGDIYSQFNSGTKQATNPLSSSGWTLASSDSLSNGSSGIQVAPSGWFGGESNAASGTSFYDLSTSNIGTFLTPTSSGPIGNAGAAAASNKTATSATTAPYTTVWLFAPAFDPCDPDLSDNADHDSDGITDVCDQDSDNDGITDFDEGACSNITGAELVQNGSMNGTKGDNNMATNWTQVAGTPDLNDENGAVQTTSGFSWYGTPLASPNGGLWQNVAGTGEAFVQTVGGLTVGNTYRFSFQWAAQALQFGGTVYNTAPRLPNVTLVNAEGYANPTTQSDFWEWNTHTQIIKATSTSITIRMQGTGNSTILPLDFTYVAYDGVSLAPCGPIDTDDDTVPDYLDLDSDNDGCYDSVEGGGSFSFLNTGSYPYGTGRLALENGTGVDTDVKSSTYGVPTASGSPQTVGTSADSFDSTDFDGQTGTLTLGAGCADLGNAPNSYLTDLTAVTNAAAVNGDKTLTRLFNGPYHLFTPDDQDSALRIGGVLAGEIGGLGAPTQVDPAPTDNTTDITDAAAGGVYFIDGAGGRISAHVEGVKPTGEAAMLCSWLDGGSGVTRNGFFDRSVNYTSVGTVAPSVGSGNEELCAEIPATDGSNAFTILPATGFNGGAVNCTTTGGGGNFTCQFDYWPNFSTTTATTTYARFRLTTDPAFFTNTSPSPTGIALGGEVEDWQLDFDPTAATIGEVTLKATRVHSLIGTLVDADAAYAMLAGFDPELAARLADDPQALAEALRRYLDPDGDGQVALFEWQTLMERGTIGFYVDRKTDTDAWARLNNGDILPALIDAPLGGQYWLVDPDALGGHDYLYQLIEQEAWGTQRQYGPYPLRME